MHEILMAEARVRDLNGQIVYLQPPGVPLVPGHQYFREQYDRGKTFCPCCTAEVAFRSRSVSVSGSTFRGRQGHFALMPGRKHDAECDILTRPYYERHLVPDRTKGYRIHINTREYSDLFNDAVGVYGRDAQGRVQINDPDLRDRERYVVKSADDLVRFFKTADNKRIADTKIIFRNQAISMEDFFIRQGLDNNVRRFESLLERLEGAKKGEELFCAMIVPIDKGHTITYKKPSVNGRTFKIGHREESDMPESIVPSVYARNQDTTHITWGFTQPGHYLVMGIPRLSTSDGHSRRFHHISITLDDPATYTRVDIRDILKNKKPRATAAASASPAP